MKKALRHANTLLNAMMRDGKDSLTGEYAERARFVSFASLMTLEAYLLDRHGDPNYPSSPEMLANIAYGFALDELANILENHGL